MVRLKLSERLSLKGKPCFETQKDEKFTYMEVQSYKGGVAKVRFFGGCGNDQLEGISMACSIFEEESNAEEEIQNAFGSKEPLKGLRVVYGGCFIDITPITHDSQERYEALEETKKMINFQFPFPK